MCCDQRCRDNVLITIITSMLNSCSHCLVTTEPCHGRTQTTQTHWGLDCSYLPWPHLTAGGHTTLSSRFNTVITERETEYEIWKHCFANPAYTESSKCINYWTGLLFPPLSGLYSVTILFAYASKYLTVRPGIFI